MQWGIVAESPELLFHFGWVGGSGCWEYLVSKLQHTYVSATLAYPMSAATLPGDRKIVLTLGKSLALGMQRQSCRNQYILHCPTERCIGSIRDGCLENEKAYISVVSLNISLSTIKFAYQALKYIRLRF